MYNFPWTNFHELNLDWFLTEWKKFKATFTGATATAETVTFKEGASVVVTGGTADEAYHFAFKIPRGISVSGIATTYASSTSATKAPETGWQSTPPAVAGGSYLWTRNILTYDNGVSDTFYSVAKMGLNGSTISSMTPEYASSTSGTETPTEWQTTPPAVAGGSYLWTRITMLFSTGERYVYYTVTRMGIDGEGAVQKVCNVSPDKDGNVPLKAVNIDTNDSNVQQDLVDLNTKITSLTADDISYDGGAEYGETKIGKAVKDLETTVGDSTDGLVKDVTDLQGTVSEHSTQIVQLETFKTSPYILSKVKAHSGKYLGDSYTAEQQSEVANGTFAGMDIGDYWIINGITWRIWDADWFLNKGDSQCTAHHLVIMPDSNLLNANGSTTKFLCSSNDTSGGYAGADNWNNTYRAQCVNTVANAFGSGHILTHRELLCNAVSSGKPIGYAWYDCTVEIPSEIMMYGSVVWGNYTDGGAGYQVGTAYPQLALATIDPSRVINRVNYWLRDVASASWFAFVYELSGAYCAAAADPWEGVRPYFLLH